MRSAENEINNSLQAALLTTDIKITCQKLTQVIETCGVHSLGNIFQTLVEDIFIHRINKWGLVRYGFFMDDYRSVQKFLGLDGAMFQLINRMQMHGVQVNGPDMATFGEYHMESFYDMQRLMCPFESYFSYFAHIITRMDYNGIVRSTPLEQNRLGLRNPNTQVMNETMLYHNLLFDYLSYYFPANADAKPPTLNTGGLFKTSTKTYPNITKSSFLLRHDFGRALTHGPTPCSETWCCDVLMNIFLTFWMYEFQQQRNESGISIAVRSKIPNEHHVLAVRCLVKSFHRFCNAHMGNTLTKRFQNDSILEQLDQNLMSKFQPRFFMFLRHCFEVWPLDQTFRMVLETWLSYIQPWRYASDVAHGSTTECSVNNNWYQFVFSNMQFYSTLFQVLIKRFIRMDISTEGNSHLLYRVARIYNQNNLITLIDQAHEEAPQLAYSHVAGNYESYVSQSYGPSEPREDDLFSPVFVSVVAQLLRIIAQALESINSSMTSRNSDRSNATWMKYSGYGALLKFENNFIDSNNQGDKKKIQQNLNYALKVFSDIFELPVPKIDKSLSGGSTRNNDIADYDVDEDGKMSLSPTGRLQLQNKLKKFPILPNAEPDLRPICSFENAFLVRFLHKFSSRFNSKYQSEIEEICKQKDILGKVCQILFQQTDEFPTLKYASHPKPHLSLRFIAHYRNLFYLFLLYALSSVFGFSFLYSCFYIVFLLAIIIFFKALFSKD